MALGLGLLIGIERERSGKEVGIRTFSFTALLGFLSWHLGPLFSVTTLVLTAVVVLVINISALQKGGGVEATTSVCLFLVAIVGMLVAQDAIITSVAVIVLLLLLLSWKEEMLMFTANLQRNELHAAISLGLLAFVIYPVLPEGALDPWGLFLPRKIWLMVVLISAIGFFNYVLLRIYGTKGITYTGILGGLVNSTATAAGLAEQSKEGEHDLEVPAFRGIIWAKSAAFLRNVIVMAIFAPTGLLPSFLPIMFMLIANSLFLLIGRKHGSKEAPAIKLASPFSMKSAMTFGAFFAAITAVGAIAEQLAGDFGFYAVSFAGGIISSSSTAATAAHLVVEGRITPEVAGGGLVLSSISSALVMLPIVWRVVPKSTLSRRVFISTIVLALAGIVGLIINPYFLQQFQVIETWISPIGL